MRISNGGSPYGRLGADFYLDISDEGYEVLVGPNNVGKSAILQLAFVLRLRPGGDGGNTAALLLTDRDHIDQSTETRGRNLASFNQELFNSINGSPMPYHTLTGPGRGELFKVLLNHSDFVTQVRKVNEYLSKLGLPDLRLRESQIMHFEQVAVQWQGSGLRSLLVILAALSDTRLSLICIDEPEVSLEPRLQKALRDLIVEEAQGRLVLVATHSHLFLNRRTPERNFIIAGGPNGQTAAVRVPNAAGLYDVLFDLLGGDTEDLFFPGNYLIVEGASDQEICVAALRLRQVAPGRVKVLGAAGVTGIERRLSSILESLVPLVVNDSPYRTRVVAMADAPNSPSDDKSLDELRGALGDRLFILPRVSIEEYLPESLYESAGRNKPNDLTELERVRSDLEKLRALKKAISRDIATVITVADLDQIPVVRDAVDAAIQQLRN